MNQQVELWPGWNTMRRIGQGSFGTVYEIQRDMMGEIEKAAIKVIIIPENARDIDTLYDDGYDADTITATFQAHLKSILREYQLMRKLNDCTNVVNCDDVRYVQQDNGIGWNIFIKMELLTPLAKALPPQITDDLVIKIGKDICNALLLCAKHNIVHRDIKPQNIFVSANGDYKLGDFGIAKIVEETTGGTIAGTPYYMAPEVYSNRPYGASADIYSLGMVMYWLLNERRFPLTPLPPEKILPEVNEEAFRRRVQGAALPPPKNGSAELKRIVLKACAYRVKDRFHTAEELMEAFETIKPQPVPFPPIPFPKDWKKWIRIAAVGIAVSAGVLFLRNTALKEQFPSSEATESATLLTETPPTTIVIEPSTEPITVEYEGRLVQSDSTALHTMAQMEWKPLTNSDSAFWGQDQYARKTVKKIIFHNTIPQNTINSWDVSADGDGAIIAWMDANELHVAADGIICPNPVASFLFYCFTELESIDFGGCFDATNITDMQQMFSKCSKLRQIDLSLFDTSNVTNMSGLFFECNSLQNLGLSNLQTENVTNMMSMFAGCSGITSLDLSHFDTSNVSNMRNMFYGCSNLEELNISGFNTSKVTDMCCMFTDVTILRNLDLSCFKTENVTDMSHMFSGCRNLQQLDLSGFITNKVKDMSNMFYNCSEIKCLDLSGFNTTSVEDMQCMFSCCGKLESIDLTGVDTSKVKNMQCLFERCYLIESLDLSSFNLSNVLDFSNMFMFCTKLSNLVIPSTISDKATSNTGMFYRCDSLPESMIPAWYLELMTQ